MKHVKLTGIMIGAILCSFGQLFAQSGNEYKLDVSSGKVIFQEIHKIEFQGYDGNGVLLKKVGGDHEESERAKGLKLINGLGLEDNTGIGLSVTKKADVVVQQLSSNSDMEYVVMVPQSVTVVYEHSSPYGDAVTFSDITGEIEVVTNHSDVNLKNVTGPMTISTVHGDIEGNFGTVNQSNPISIISSHGDIDVAIPATTKANLTLDTGWGEIYSDLDIAIEQQEKMKRYSSNSVKGKINGGGVEMKIKSSHGSIYLRKK